MSKITYTFANDTKVPEILRGVTCTGGVFCAKSGKWQDQIDAVKFDTIIDNRRIVAMIAGKPELELLLAQHMAAIAAKDAILANIGWPQYQKIQSKAINTRHAYDDASEYGYPAKEANAMRLADEALNNAAQQYPLAAAYGKAEAYSMAAHDQKASLGNKAMIAIELGAEPLQTIANMESCWSAVAAQCVNNN